jgi:Bacterial SH3 domain
MSRFRRTLAARTRLSVTPRCRITRRGNGNTAVGNFALSANSGATAVANTAVGDLALGFNGTGSGKHCHESCYQKAVEKTLLSLAGRAMGSLGHSAEAKDRLMRMNLWLAQRSLIAALSISFVHLAMADNRGVVDGPDECANLRSEKRKDAEVVAKLKTGEPFTFESKEGDQWCKVTLASKKVGWMQCSCIRLFITKKDWPHGTPPEIASTFGQEYHKVMRRAESGDKDALKRFFAFGKGLDGAGAENHDGVVLRVIHILGDTRLAEFCRVSRRPIKQD